MYVLSVKKYGKQKHIFRVCRSLERAINAFTQIYK